MPDLINYANSLACLVMMGYMLVIAIKMPHRGMWGRRAIVIGLTVALGFQVASPFEGWIPKIVWHGALLHTFLALALLIWREEAMAFIRCKFTLQTPNFPMRRADDWQMEGQ